MNKTKQILLCACVAVGLTARASLPDPIAYFAFDEIRDGIVADLSGHGRDLTVGAGCALTNDAAAGSALWLEGDTATFAQFAVPSLPKRTISFWYKRSHQPGPNFEEKSVTADKHCLMPTLIANLSKFNLRFNNSWADANDHALGIGNCDLVAYYGDGGALSGFYVSYGKYPQVYPEKWTHLAYAIEITDSRPLEGSNHLDTFNLRFYVNGELWFAQDGGATTNAYPSSTVTLGNSAKDGPRPCRGALDEFKVFDQFLSADQVRAEYDRCKDTANRFRLVAWYPFQEFSEPDGDGNFTTPDQSPWGVANGQVMTCSAETSVASGLQGDDRAIHFQGTARTCAFAAVPFKVEDFTMAAWVNVSTNTSIVRIEGETANYPRLITWGNFTSYYTWVLSSLQNQYTMPGDSAIRTFARDGLACKGDWQHIAWVVRNVRTSTDTVANAFKQVHDYYVNGELVNTSPEVAGGTLAAKTTLILGNYSTTRGTRVFEGDVSDFRLYAGAMNADEVRMLYRGAAAVDAGVDETVSGARAVLKGTVGTDRGTPGAYGYAGTVAWSLVSAPDGGAAVEFLRPDNPVTEVTLPVEGTYVFRLTTTAYDAAQSDTVTITRDDAAGTVSEVPSVDAAAVAAEATVRASLADGLIRHWTANGLARREEVSGTVGMEATDWSLVGLTNGVTGSAFCSRANVPFGGTLATAVTSGETAGAYGNGYEPANEWLTISAWIRPEADYPDDWFAGVLVHLPLTLSVCYGQWWSPSTATDVLPGFCIQQTGILGYQAWLNYDLPSGTDMKSLCGKWSHVVALVNRHDTSQSSFYLNGEKLTENTARRNCGNYPTYTDDKGAAVNFSGQPCGGRWNGQVVTLLNTQSEIGGANNTIHCASNTTTNVRYSRHFPGAVDEIRFYSRKLTEAEIAFLHAHPDVSANAAPVVAKAVSAPTLVKKRASALAATAADDGNGTATLAYEWRVVRGDPAQVVFADPSAAETTVTVKAKGRYAFALRVSDGERATVGEPVEVEVQNPGLAIILR